MCVQCAATAAAAVGSASGVRAWLRSHAGDWLTPGRLRTITIGLLALAVVVSGVGLGGSG
jgi:hypothetical protein